MLSINLVKYNKNIIHKTISQVREIFLKVLHTTKSMQMKSLWIQSSIMQQHKQNT